MKIFFIDLDDTLVDTSHFKDNMFSVLNTKTEISYPMITELYNSLRVGGQLEENWLPDFARLVSRKCDFTKKEISDVILELVKTLKVRKNIIDYVLSIKETKCILTSGNKKLQKQKVSELGLQKYFDQVIYVSGQKSNYLLERIKNNGIKIGHKLYDEVVIIDDKIDLLKVFKKYNFVKLIHPDNIK